MIRVSIDIGGVLSRHPLIYKPIMRALAASDEIELYVLTDMIRDNARAVLEANGFTDIVPNNRLICSEWGENGKLCKAKICSGSISIDLHIAEIPSYILGETTIGLLQMPCRQPYYSDDWIEAMSRADVPDDEELIGEDDEELIGEDDEELIGE